MSVVSVSSQILNYNSHHLSLMEMELQQCLEGASVMHRTLCISLLLHYFGTSVVLEPNVCWHNGYILLLTSGDWLQLMKHLRSQTASVSKAMVEGMVVVAVPLYLITGGLKGALVNWNEGGSWSELDPRTAHISI